MPNRPSRYSVPALLLLVASSTAADPTPADKPAPVAEAAARMTVPEGFRVTLFAGEPDVAQPIAMTFDDRGRLWVVECLSYPNWRADGTGRDRVVILEDTDGDGKHDKRTVFLDNGSNLSGIALGFGGVWLCSLPNLIFVPTNPGEDKPAGPPQVVLDGWNLKDTKHNVFNSLAWGPDGWLYGCNGIQARSRVGKPGTPDKDRVFMDCGVWRYHPTRKVFEVYATGTTNPFGLDWDDYGQLFITNCVIDHLWHVVPGAHFRRMYGQDANPYLFDLMGPASDHKHWAGGHWTESRADQKTGAVKKGHDDAGGGHAHAGCCVYLGDNFPPEYRNSVFMCNIHGSRLNRDALHFENGRYVGKHAPDFLKANDPWFRGLCVKYGPDGGLYVSDWTDTGECHNYEKADTTNGRIYKVTFGAPKPWQKDLGKASGEELAKLAVGRNEWESRHARRLLQERTVAGKPPAGVVGSLRDRLNDLNEPAAAKLRAVWALHVVGGLADSDFITLLGRDQPEAVRAWAALLAVERPDGSGEIVNQLLHLAREEKSPLVRRYLAAAMQRVPDDVRMQLADPLLGRAEDNADRDLSLLYWYGVQPLVLSRPDAALALAARTQNHLVREFVVRCYLTRPGVTAPAALPAAVVTLMASPAGEARRAVLRAVRQALAGHRGLKPPEGWAVALDHLLDTAGSRAERYDLLDLAVQFGDEGQIAHWKNGLANPAIDLTSRSFALKTLTRHAVPGLGPILRQVLDQPDLRGEAVRALAAYPDADTPAAVLKHYPTFTATEKADAVQTLASRPAFALALLAAVEKGTVPKADVTAFTARQLQALNDKQVSARLAAVWGTVRPASQTRAAQTDRLKKLLTPDALKAADLPNGRRVFARSCASCHKLFGEGGDVGPELTGSQRANLDYVLENVLDPSAVVPGEYRMTAFTLADGRVLTGIVRRETKQAVTVRTVNDEVTVPAADIDARKPTPLSVMPDGLLDALKDNEVRDLVAYLASPRQVPLPADQGKPN